MRAHGKRWLWVLLVLLGVLGLTACQNRSATSQTEVTVHQLSPKEAYAFLQSHKNDPNLVILDVRTPQEFQAGHIAGATNLDYYARDFPQKLSQLDKNKTYFVYCRTGHRSGNTVAMMRRMGFRNIYELQGGILNWVQAGLPVVSGP